MPDRNYTIRIVTVADGAGARETVAGLDQTADAAGRAKEANEHHGKSFAHVESGARNFHKILHSITEESPLAGIAIRGFLDPASAGLAALVYAIGRVKEDLKHLNESLTTSQWENYTGIADKAKIALQNAEIAADAFNRKLIEIRTSAITASEAVEEKFKTLNTTIERLKQFAKERGDIGEAGHLTDEQAHLKIAELDQSMAGEVTSRSHLQAQLKAARERQRALPTEETVEGTIGLQERRLAQTSEELEKKRARSAELHDKGWLRRSTPQQQEMNYLDQQVEQLDTIETQQRDYVERLKRRRKVEVEVIQSTNDEVSRLEGELKATEERIKKLGTKRPGLVETTGIETSARHLEQSPVGGPVLVAGSQALAHLHEHHGRVQELSEADRRAIEALDLYLRSHGVLNLRMLELIERSAGNLNALEQRLNQIESRTNQRMLGLLTNPT